MTREEKILNAAREYNNGIILSSPSNVLHFEAGAKWADEHPKNKWHSVDDVPVGQHDIICKNNEGKCWHCTWQYIYDNYLSWKEFVGTMNVEKWICIHEL